MSRTLLLFVALALIASVFCQDAPYGQYYPSYRQYYYNYYQQYSNQAGDGLPNHVGRQVRRSSHLDRYGGNHH